MREIMIILSWQPDFIPQVEPRSANVRQEFWLLQCDVGKLWSVTNSDIYILCETVRHQRPFLYFWYLFYYKMTKPILKKKNYMIFHETTDFQLLVFFIECPQLVTVLIHPLAYDWPFSAPTSDNSSSNLCLMLQSVVKHFRSSIRGLRAIFICIEKGTKKSFISN